MNNCQGALVRLVRSRLKPVNKPISKAIIRGPYLSKAQPPIKAKIRLSAMWAENTPEVAARLRLNSLSMDLKNTPKDWNEP